MKELKEKTKEVFSSENIVNHTLGSQENAFENVKPTYNGDQVYSYSVVYLLSIVLCKRIYILFLQLNF